jgi:hypothetical protein
MSDELERVSPKENAHVKARDKKVRGPKVVAVNPGLKKLALHLADKRRNNQKPSPHRGRGRGGGLDQPHP